MSDLKPLVSCLTATYGRFSLLQEMYWCWINQSYENKELIICNDQENLTITCKNPNVKILNLSTRFKTLGEKRNFLLQNISSESKYVLICDDDDLFYPNHITSLVDGFSDDKILKVVNKRHFVAKDNKFINYSFFFPYFCASMFRTDFITQNKFTESNTHEADNLLKLSTNLSNTIQTKPTFIHRLGMNVIHALDGNKNLDTNQIYKLIEEKRENVTGEIELIANIKKESLDLYTGLKSL